MILVSNVKITQHRWGIMPRGNLNIPSRYDIWKYTLASYASIESLFTKIILYINLDEFIDNKDDLSNFIYDMFPADKIILKWQRNETILDWQKSYTEDIEPINDSLIFNLCNDDHVFVDKNTSAINLAINQLTALVNEPHALIAHGHWPEYTIMANQGRYAISNDNSCYIGRRRSFDAIDILKKERFYHYYFANHGIDINASGFFRSDSLHHHPNVLPHSTPMIVPRCEITRHFDGYQTIYMNSFPPLEIPIGFFEKQIKIAYGYSESKEGYVHINPSIPNLKAAEVNGVDYKWALEDIPLFWKDRISEILINPDADIELLREYRDQFLYDTAYRQLDPNKQLKDIYISNKWKSYST